MLLRISHRHLFLHHGYWWQQLAFGLANNNNNNNTYSHQQSAILWSRSHRLWTRHSSQYIRRWYCFIWVCDLYSSEQNSDRPQHPWPRILQLRWRRRAWMTGTNTKSNPSTCLENTSWYRLKILTPFWKCKVGALANNRLCMFLVLPFLFLR